MTDNVCAIGFGQRRCLENWQQKCKKMKIFKKAPKEYQQVRTPKRLLEIRFEMIVMSRKKVMAHNVCAIGLGQRRCLEHWQQKCEKMKIFKNAPNIHGNFFFEKKRKKTSGHHTKNIPVYMY